MRGKVPFRPWATSFFDIGGGWLAVKRCGRIAVADYNKAGAGVGASNRVCQSADIGVGKLVLRRKLSDIGQLIPVQEGETIEITTNSLIVHVKPSNLILEKSSSSAFQYFKQVALTFDAQQRTA